MPIEVAPVVADLNMNKKKETLEKFAEDIKRAAALGNLKDIITVSFAGNTIGALVVYDEAETESDTLTD